MLSTNGQMRNQTTDVRDPVAAVSAARTTSTHAETTYTSWLVASLGPSTAVTRMTSTPIEMCVMPSAIHFITRMRRLSSEVAANDSVTAFVVQGALAPGDQRRGGDVGQYGGGAHDRMLPGDLGSVIRATSRELHRRTTHPVAADRAATSTASVGRSQLDAVHHAALAAALSPKRILSRLAALGLARSFTIRCNVCVAYMDAEGGSGSSAWRMPSDSQGRAWRGSR